MSKKVLLAGESWMSYTTHVKGFDAFYTSTYETGEKWFREAMKAAGYEYTFLPNHEATDGFPFTVEELKQYDCVVLSDIGANTLLLPTATFARSEKMPDRTKVIRDYVLDGGALLMVGGYLTFSGVDAKGKWHDTAVQEVLPVEVLTVDDRMEHCDGVVPVIIKEHEALAGLPKEFPNAVDYASITTIRDSSTGNGNDYVYDVTKRGMGCKFETSTVGYYWIAIGH